MAPTGFAPEFLRSRFDVLSVDPPIVRWRSRPPEDFDDEVTWRVWNKKYAGQTIRSQVDGRLRVKLDERTFDLRALVAEIGVTRIGDLQGTPDAVPNDRLAAEREIAGTGPLSLILKEAIDDTGRSVDDLMVLSKGVDPYRIDTPAKRRDAQWFADRVAEFVAPGRRIHVRGIFYSCVAAQSVKPDGTAFVNDAAHEAWLGDIARYARWLGYVDFERLVDNKNSEPDPAPEVEEPEGYVGIDRIETDELDADDLAIRAELTGFEARQPYRLVFFGEKTSLEDVVGPRAAWYRADLYLCSGQISDTLVHRIAKDTVEDGRPLVVFTLSDCDPAGHWDMPTAIGRKLQALRDLKFPELEFTLVQAGLSPDQARALDLPSSPLKEGERRGAMWLETYGLEQTEIDALATLRPDVLARLIDEAVAPYFDVGLAGRVAEAKAEWREEADAEIEAQVDDEALDTLKVRARAAIRELEEVNSALNAMAAGIELDTLIPDLPEPDTDALEAAQDERRDAVLIDSDMDFVEGTDRLREHNELDARRARQKERV
jgi:hypothetical protein